MAAASAVGVLKQVGIDVNDLDRASKFWQGVLGVQEDTRSDPYLAFKPILGGLILYLQKVPEKKTAKTRLHLDIDVNDLESAAKRVEELGGKRVQKFDQWIVMEDPDGNEFCLTRE